MSDGHSNANTKPPQLFEGATIAAAASVCGDGAQVYSVYRERLDANLGRFGDFNEPFYRTYITEDFGAASADELPARLPWQQQGTAGATVILLLAMRASKFAISICIRPSPWGPALQHSLSRCPLRAHDQTYIWSGRGACHGSALPCHCLYMMPQERCLRRPAWSQT